MHLAMFVSTGQESLVVKFRGNQIRSWLEQQAVCVPCPCPTRKLGKWVFDDAGTAPYLLQYCARNSRRLIVVI